MCTYTYHHDNGDVEFDVDFKHVSGTHDYFSDGCWYPGDPQEVYILSIRGPNGKECFHSLKSKIKEKIEDYICENIGELEYEL